MSERETKRDKGRDHAEMQRNRILDAAEKCFIKDGFHVATMANISEEAEMSTGLIYRYFENKNAVILAIIDRELRERREEIGSLGDEDDLAGRLVDLVRSWRTRAVDKKNPVLFIEMSVEGSRNSEVARALEEADRLTRTDLRKWLKGRSERNGVEISEKMLTRKALALQCFLEGMALRTVREPEIGCEALSESIRWFLRQIFSLPEE